MKNRKRRWAFALFALYVMLQILQPLELQAASVASGGDDVSVISQGIGINAIGQGADDSLAEVRESVIEDETSKKDTLEKEISESETLKGESADTQSRSAGDITGVGAEVMIEKGSAEVLDEASEEGANSEAVTLSEDDDEKITGLSEEETMGGATAGEARVFANRVAVRRATGYAGQFFGVNVWHASDYASFLQAWIEIHVNYGGVGHIQLTGDIYKESCWDVGNGVNISIDLNGHTIYAAPRTFYAVALEELFCVQAGGRLHFYDGSIDGRGLCYFCTNPTIGAMMTVNPGGTLILERCSIGNVTNMHDFNQAEGEGGGTIINQYGTLFATDVWFHDCSGTAIYGQDSQHPTYGDGAYTKLTNCSSDRVSGLWSDGESRAVRQTFFIDGGTYHIGREGHYLAGIESRTPAQITLRGAMIGGCVYLWNQENLSVERSSIDLLQASVAALSNQKRYALSLVNVASVAVSDSSIVGQTASDCDALCIAGGTSEFEFYRTTIQNAKNTAAIIWGAKTLFEGCNIRNASNGIYSLVAAVTVVGGSVCDNAQGIYNGGTLSVSDATIARNQGYDIVQAGELSLSGNANIAGNGILLQPDKFIDISGALHCADGCIYITLEESDCHVGRRIADCFYERSAKSAEAACKKFTLTNATTLTPGRVAGTYRTAVLRPGYGENGAIGSVLLSECYDVIYDANTKMANDRLTADFLPTGTIYWKEACSLHSPTVILRYDGSVFRSLEQTGWCQDAAGGGETIAPGATKSYNSKDATRDWHWYATYRGIADVSICGNEQTVGEDYVISHFVSNETLLPQNSFEKRYEYETYDENLRENQTEIISYAHMGWASRSDACYKDADVVTCGTSVDLLPLLREQITSGNLSILKEGYAVLTFYSVWDEPPVIDAKNRTITVEEIESGMLTEEAMLRDATVSDREDGTDLSFHVELPDAKELLSLGNGGYHTMRYVAVDGAGNETSRVVRLYVSSGSMYEGSSYEEAPIVRRAIDRENYEKSKEEEGALMKESIWYEDASYRALIEKAFLNLEEGDAVKQYFFAL